MNLTMKKFTVLLFALFTFSTFIFAQEVQRCHTMEADAALRAKYPELGTLDQFENWLAPKVQAYKDAHPDEASRAAGGIITIPIIFHVVHNGESVGSGSNISATYINANIEQLNNDFRKKFGTSGYNTTPAGADLFVEFCPATVDPNGNALAEPGINRINRNTEGWSSPPYSDTYIDATIKPGSYWNPNDYCNVWSLNLGGLLGYAQFPSQSGLSGLNVDGGPASTDGVVCTYTSIGSSVTPNPSGGVFDEGRTLTHEIGHWLGLRHIWGDGSGCASSSASTSCACGNDDYCADTPNAGRANYGCPTAVTCGSTDMKQNYMDYTNDACMNTFTNDQSARVQAVLSNALRRDFTGSTACATPGINLTRVIGTASQTVNGSTISISAAVQNTGNQSSGGFYVAWVLSEDVFFDNPIVIGYQYVSSLAAGAQSNILSSGVIDINTLNIPGGNYYYGYSIDHYGYIAETNENDNIWQWAPQIITSNNVNCDDAIELTCGVAYTGTTVGGNDYVDSQWGCTSFNESGPEVVHTITTIGPGDITATLSNEASGLDVFILNACRVDSCQAFGFSSATMTNAPAGTYYIVVDGYNEAEGAYTLTVDGNCSMDCASATPISCGETISGTTVGAGNNITNYGCVGGDNGEDKIYSITTIGSGTITAALTNESDTGLEIFILNACNVDSCMAWGGSTAVTSTVPAGTYYIVVDGYPTASGSFDLTVTCNDELDCSNAVALACGVPYSGNTNSGTNVVDYWGCFGDFAETGNEVMHTFNNPSGGDITVTFTSPISGLDVLLLNACDVNSCLNSSTAGGGGFTYAGASAGTYYLVVDGFNGQNDTYTLTVDYGCLSNTCDIPTGINCVAYSGNVARANWTAVADGERYRLRYRPVGGSWTEVLTGGAENFRYFNGLTPNTTYQYQVKTQCASLNSAWSATYTFTTLGSVCDLTSIYTHDADINDATLYWTADPADEKYRLKYRPKGVTGSWTQIDNITNTQQYISGLLSGTEYKVKIKVRCEAGWTQWQANYDFFTSGSPSITEGSETINRTILTPDVKVFPNPATYVLNFATSTDFTDYQIVDMSGRVMSRQEVNGNQIDISNLLDGVYFISFITENDKVTKRFIKQSAP